MLSVFILSLSIAVAVTKVPTYQIGVVIDQTTNRTASQETLRGLKVAADLARSKENVNLQLNVVDSGPLAIGTHKAMVEMVKGGNDVIIAEISSSKAEVAAQVAERNKKVMVTPFATAKAVTAGRHFVFRPCAGHLRQAAGLVKFLRAKHKVKTGGIIFDQGQLFSTDLKDRFRDEFEKTGNKLQFVLPVLTAQGSFKEIIKTLKENQVDFVYLPMYEEVTAKLLAEVISAQVKLPLVVGGDGWQNDSVFNAIVFSKNPSFSGYYVTHHNPRSTNPLQTEFEHSFRRRYGNAPSTSASYLAYDSVFTILAALKARRHPGQEALREALAENVKVRGATGSIEFRGGQEPAEKTLYLVHFEGPKILSVEAF